MQSNIAMSNIRESDIVDVVGVFVRNKWRGCVIVCVVVLIGVITSFVFPAPYETEEIVRIASVGGQPVETVDALKAIFGTDAVANEIATTLNLSSQGAYERYTIEETDGGGEKWLIRIRGREVTPEKAKAVTELVSKKVFIRLQGSAQSYQDILRREVENLHREQDGIEREVARLGILTKRFFEETKYYQSEITKRADVQSDAQGRIVGAYTQLLADAKSRSDSSLHEIESLKQRSAVIQADILRKQADIEHATPRVEVEAVLPGRALVSPQLIQNVIYSTVLGIFLAAVWILVREYHIVRIRKPQ